MIIKVIDSEISKKLETEFKKVFDVTVKALEDFNNISILPYPDDVTLTNWSTKIETSAEIKNSLVKYKNLSGIYVICVKKREQKTWEFKYIGQKSSNSKERFTQHFIKKAPKTGSKLVNVKKAVSSGKQVGLIFMETNPYYLRLPIEEYILQTFKEKFKWNSRSKKEIQTT